MAQAFRADRRPDPRLDEDGIMCFFLTEQWRAYRNEDGSKKKQKALPMFVLRKMLEIANSEWDRAVSWLLIGAIFFAMRSCEYLETKAKEEDRRTRILRLRNFKFRVKGGIVNWEAKDIHEGDLVIITFEYQKNDKRDVRVHQFSTTDSVLNPVLAWANTIYRLKKIPGVSGDTKVSMILEGGKVSKIKADQVRIHLRSVVMLVGETALGFSIDDIGLYSIRSGGAMAMVLSRVPDIVTMKIGRWSSLAFLEYIRD